MNDQMKDHIGPKRPSQRNHRKQLLSHNVPTNDVQNTYGTNNGGDLRLINKLRIVPSATDTMPQVIQRLRRATLH